MNAIAAIGGADLMRIVAAYRALVPSALWMLGLRAARDSKDPYKRSLEALVEPFMNAYFMAQAQRQAAEIVEHFARNPLQIGDVDPALAARAVMQTLEQGLGSALVLVVMLDRAHALAPIELVLTDDVTPLARTAAAWARARNVPVVTIPDHARFAQAPDLPSQTAVATGDRARRAFAAGESSAACTFCPPAPPPEALPSADRAARRAAVRQAMVRTLGWGDDDIVVLFEPAAAVRDCALDPADPLGASLIAMFTGFAGARAKVPNLRLVIAAQPAADGFVRAEAAAKAVGLGTAHFAYTDTDHDTWTAGADIAVGVDSARSIVAAVCGVPSINLWRPVSWYRGPLFAAEDGVIDASAQALAGTIVALAGDAALRAQIAAIAFDRNAADIPAAPQVVTTLARQLVAQRRIPPAIVRQAKRDIVIVAPDFVHWSAGIRALHRLCHFINLLGGDAFVFPATQFHPNWNTPRRETQLTERTIVIHPESTEKIFRHGRLVRWVLNVPGLLGGPKIYDDDEMIFYFSRSMRAAAQSATSELLDDRRELTLTTTDPELFYNDRSKPRLYDCVYIGKGRSTYDRVQPRQIRDAFVIERLTAAWPAQRHETATLLRGCRRLYTFDEHTAIADEAALCGARVIYVREDGKLKPEWNHHEDRVRMNVASYYDDTPVVRFLEVLKERWD